jgi:hypothetical protein
MAAPGAAHHRSASAARLCSVLSVLLALGLLATTCNAHGFLSSPRSRALVLGYQQWEAAGANGLGPRNAATNDYNRYSIAPFPYRADKPDVCGDP